jgi:hypothetical protein
METPAPPPPEAPPDPTPVLKASLDDAQADENKLKAELAALETSLKDKVAQCKPIEPPKPPPPPPPPVQAAKPPPPPPPPPQQQAAAPAAPPAPPVNRPPANCPATGRAIPAARASPATDTIWVTSPDSWASTTTCM